MPHSAKKKFPAPAKAAREALEKLRAENEALADEVAKILPAFAVRQKIEDADQLLDHARQGAAHLKSFKQVVENKRSPIEHYEALMKTWRKIANEEVRTLLTIECREDTLIERISGKRAELNHLPQLSAEDFFSIAITSALHEVIDYLFSKGFQPKGIKQEVLLAIEAGHPDIIKQLRENGITDMDYGDIICSAVKTGHLGLVDYLYQADAELHVHMYDALTHAARHGQKEILTYLLEKGFNAPDKLAAAFEEACEHGQHETVKFLHQRGVDPTGRSDLLGKAANRGHLKVVKYLYENVPDLRPSAPCAFLDAAAGGHIEVMDYLGKTGVMPCDLGPDLLHRAVQSKSLAAVKYVHEHGVNITNTPLAMEYAAQHNLRDIMEYLHKNGADLHAHSHQLMSQAVSEETWRVVKYLSDNGIYPNVASTVHRDRAQYFLGFHDNWQRIAHCEPPPKCEKLPPAPYKLETFKDLHAILTREGYENENTFYMAYRAAALFGSTDRVMQYLEKWGSYSTQPLHDVIYMIDVKPGGNLKLWGDAVMSCGTGMAKMTKYMDQITVPERSDDGKAWSIPNTRALVAKVVFAHMAKDSRLVELCLRYNLDPDDFEKVITLQPATKKNIPEIVIPGEKFGMPDASFRKLANDDIRALFLGEMSGCCQSVGGAGEPCAIHGYTSENGGFYVIEKNDGKIIGQTWAWRGKKGELCFDSLESRKGSVTEHHWQKILKEVGRELEEKKDAHDIAQLNVGWGGNTPVSVRGKFQQSALAKPKDYDGYRDSGLAQVMVWKREESGRPKRPGKHIVTAAASRP